jgi:hypothetical protein
VRDRTTEWVGERDVGGDRRDGDEAGEGSAPNELVPQRLVGALAEPPGELRQQRGRDRLRRERDRKAREVHGELERDDAARHAIRDG